MLTKWFSCLFLFTGFLSVLHAESFSQAVDSLKECPYGFYFFDVGLTEQDLADFESIDIQQEQYYQQFGELSKTESGIADFLAAIGRNESDLAVRVAKKLAEITEQVMAVSGRETAWVHLRASVPTDAYDIPRWHIDGQYYRPESDVMMLRFAVTLSGSPTLFYLLPKEQRRTAWTRMQHRQFMQTFCQAGQVVVPNPGEGIFFIGGSEQKGALHTEPPIHENRLFFSIVPCREDQLGPLKTKILAIYPKKES